MYNTLKRLYDSGRLPAENLKKAVTLEWITDDDYKAITGQNYNTDNSDTKSTASA
jgi:hypothetical protein